MGGRTLVFLELGDGSIEEKGRLELEHDIACLDVTPVGQSLGVKTFLLASRPHSCVAYSGSGASPPAAHTFHLLTLSATPAGAETERSDAAAVGTWGMEALILTLPGLKPLFKETLPTDVIPRRWGTGLRCCPAAPLAVCLVRVPACCIQMPQLLDLANLCIPPYPASPQHAVCPV